MGEEEDAWLLLGDAARMGSEVRNGASGSTEKGQTQTLLRVTWWQGVDP